MDSQENEPKPEMNRGKKISGGVASAAAADVTRPAAIGGHGGGKSIGGFVNRLFELLALLAASLMALFFYHKAAEERSRSLRLEGELRLARKAKLEADKTAALGDTGSFSGTGGGACAVCLEEPLEVALRPCGHVCVCLECADKLDRCPMCRSVVKRKTRVYLST